MKLNKETKINIELSKDEVKSILIRHLISNGDVPRTVDLESVLINDIKEIETILGADVHDCDYIEHFNGIKLDVKTKK